VHKREKVIKGTPNWTEEGDTQLSFHEGTGGGGGIRGPRTSIKSRRRRASPSRGRGKKGKFTPRALKEKVRAVQGEGEECAHYHEKKTYAGSEKPQIQRLGRRSLSQINDVTRTKKGAGELVGR